MSSSGLGLAGLPQDFELFPHTVDLLLQVLQVVPQLLRVSGTSALATRPFVRLLRRVVGGRWVRRWIGMTVVVPGSVTTPTTHGFNPSSRVSFSRLRARAGM
jgi:hypothetical protein